MAERGPRFGARVIDVMAELALVIATLALLGDSDRPFAAMAIAWVTLLVYEAGFVAALGATPGKLAVGLRVVGIGEVSRAPLAQAAKRGAVNAALTGSYREILKRRSLETRYFGDFGSCGQRRGLERGEWRAYGELGEKSFPAWPRRGL